MWRERRTSTSLVSLALFLATIRLHSILLMVEASSSSSPASSAHSEEENETVDCPLTLMIPFGDKRRDGDWYGKSESIRDNKELFDQGITMLTTALIAVDDFNRKISQLAEGLGSNNNYKSVDESSPYRLSSCPIKLSVSSVLDSSLDSSIITEQTISPETHSDPGAVIGPHDEESVQSVLYAIQQQQQNATLSSINYYTPIFSYGRILESTSDSSHNLLFLSPSWEDSISALADYLIAKNRVSSILNDDGGVAILESYTESVYSFNLLKPDHAVSNSFVSFAIETSANYWDALNKVNDLGIQTIVVNFEWDNQLEMLAATAESLDMLSDDHLWIFMDRYISPNDVILLAYIEPGSSTECLLRQARIFQVVDPLTLRYRRYDWHRREEKVVLEPSSTSTFEKIRSQWYSAYDNFAQQIDDLFVQQQQQQQQQTSLPLKQLEANPIDANFYYENFPTYGSGFIYDSVIAAGLSACIKYNMKEGAGEVSHVTTTSSNDINNMIDHHVEDYNYYLHPELYSDIGGSFYLSVNGTRDPGGFSFGIFVFDRSYDDRPFRASLFDHTTTNGIWTVNEEHDDMYLFYEARIAGFVMGSIAVLLCFTSVVFVFLYRMNPIIRVAQPAFLYMLCVGASLFGVSIIFVSFDDWVIANLVTLDRFCMLQVWLRMLGHIIMYMALFCKLWRINQICKFRKGQKIFVHHVIWPFMLAVVAAVAVLIAYTVTSPSGFYRLFVGSTDDDLISVDDDFVDGWFRGRSKDQVTTSFCEVHNAYLLTLRVFVLMALFLVTFMSYRTRTLAEDLSDSKRIFEVVVINVAIGCAGFVSSLLFQIFGWPNYAHTFRLISSFLYSTTAVCGLVGTKMYKIWRQSRAGEEQNDLFQGRVKVSGLESPPPQSCPTTSSKPPFTQHGIPEHSNSSVCTFDCTTTECTHTTDDGTIPQVEDPSPSASHGDEDENDAEGATILEAVSPVQTSVIPEIESIEFGDTDSMRSCSFERNSSNSNTDLLKGDEEAHIRSLSSSNRLISKTQTVPSATTRRTSCGLSHPPHSPAKPDMKKRDSSTRRTSCGLKSVSSPISRR